MGADRGETAAPVVLGVADGRDGGLRRTAEAKGMGEAVAFPSPSDPTAVRRRGLSKVRFRVLFFFAETRRHGCRRCRPRPSSRSVLAETSFRNFLESSLENGSKDGAPIVENGNITGTTMFYEFPEISSECAAIHRT